MYKKILLQVYYSNFRLDLFSIQFTKKEAPQKFLGRGYFTSTTWNLNGKLCPKHFEYNAPSLCWAQCSKNPTKIRKNNNVNFFLERKNLKWILAHPNTKKVRKCRFSPLIFCHFWWFFKALCTTLIKSGLNSIFLILLQINQMMIQKKTK